MRLTNFLEDIFGQKSKVKILRVFFKTKMALTGRQIAELADLNHRTAQLTLADLENQALIKSRIIGRASLFELNTGNYFVEKHLAKFFEEEGNFLKSFVLGILDGAQKEIDSLIFFGEAAQGREKEESEINFLAVSDLKKEKQEQLELKIKEEFFRSFGKMVTIFWVSKKELLEAVKKSQPLFQEAAKTGQVILGRHFTELFSHGH